MTLNKLFLLLIFSLTLVNGAMAQSDSLENTFFESGKIKVVIGVAVIIFSGISFYLYRLDKKITRLEKEIKNEKN
ncbi:MAG: CcmD family protein [Bacteroidota bacterium]|jgi:CcmD family protein